MKKITAILMSFLLAFGLTACGGQNDSEARDAEKAQETETAQPESSQAEESQEPEEIAGAAEDDGAEGQAGGAGGKTLVVYFSASGNTKAVAEYIAAATNGDVFELEPKMPYSDEDLDWTDDNSRVTREHENPDDRNVELVAETIPDWDSYDTVFIG